MYRIILLLIIFGMTSCSSQPTAEVVTAIAALPTPDADWSLTMTHSGGIMGLMRSITLNSDGEFSATDERLSRTFTGQLTSDQLAEIQSLVANMQYTEPSRPNAVCADCFVYAFQIQKGNEQLFIQVDDITLPNSGMETLTSILVELLDAMLR